MMRELAWDRMQGLIPAIVQDWRSGAVLMLGYMNEQALQATRSSGHVTFFSRSKQRLWTKGESSGNHLLLKEIALDCDADALLVLAEPQGPTCHLGTATCWGESAPQALAQTVAFLPQLEQIIDARIERPSASSYTSQLMAQGTRRIAQKVGEEGIELALAAVAQSAEEVTEEAADLLYHVLVLLRSQGIPLASVDALLRDRHARSR